MPFDRNALPEPLGYYESQGLTFRERKGRWRTTRCDFHQGSDSMRVNVQTGAWVCMACGVHGGDVLSYEMQLTGADFVSAAKTLGCWSDDGKPTTQNKPTPIPARAALQALSFEALLVAVEAARVAKGAKPTDRKSTRLNSS